MASTATAPARGPVRGAKGPPVCGFTLDGHTCRSRGPHRCRPRIAHVHAFFTELLVHTKGNFARKPFVPSQWQRRRVLEPLFGEVAWDDHWQTYVRRYRTLYLFVPRKNGKTELLAGIVLYLLCADGEEQAEIYGLAVDRDQAGHVYRAAARMVELSGPLSRRLQVVRSTVSLVDQRSGSFYRVTAADAGGALGANPHGAYIDELLTQPNRDLYDAIRTGMGTRSQPILMLATTAENDPTGFASIEREWSQRVVDDPDLDRSRLCVMYAAPADADWQDEAVWHGCNPALGDFLDIRALRDEAAKAKANPADERSFRQYRLNQPMRAVGRAIAITQWDAASGGPLDVTTLRRRPCFAGLDLASASDLAAIAYDFPAADGTHDVIWRHFIPEAAVGELDRHTGGRVRVWVTDGYLTVTPGNVIDYKAILAVLEADKRAFDIREVAYDRWGMTQLAQDLTDAGAKLVAFGQGFASMSAPTRELLRLVAQGAYHHHDDPVARWQASNLVVRTDPAGNMKPDKNASLDKVDGMVAAVMALDRAARQSVQRRPRVAGF